jgi:hypothetical protein
VTVVDLSLWIVTIKDIEVLAVETTILIVLLIYLAQFIYIELKNAFTK